MTVDQPDILERIRRALADAETTDPAAINEAMDAGFQNPARWSPEPAEREDGGRDFFGLQEPEMGWLSPLPDSWGRGYLNHPVTGEDISTAFHAATDLWSDTRHREILEAASDAAARPVCPRCGIELTDYTVTVEEQLVSPGDLLIRSFQSGVRRVDLSPCGCRFFWPRTARTV